MIRPTILRILVHRELLRLFKSPSALALLGLLAAVALMIATSKPPQPPRPTCHIVYWKNSPWVEFLKKNVAAEKGIPIRVRHVDELRNAAGRVAYPMGDLAIEIEPPYQATKRSPNDHDEQILIVYRYSGKDANVLRPYQQWFWHKSAEHLGHTPQIASSVIPVRAENAADLAQLINQASIQDLVNTEVMATLMVFMLQFFSCCYLFVSFTAQDRERGTLLALALTPATTREILLAKFVFHLAISLLMTAVILSILVPAALPRPWLWIVIAANSIGLMSIGTVITTLTRSQTAAGLLTLCYMMSLGVVFYLSTKFSAFLLVQRLMFERYGFPLMFVSIKTNLPLAQVASLWWLTAIVAAWFFFAMTLFHRRGWR